KKALPKAEFDELRENQRAWVEQRDHLARSPLFTGANVQGDLALDSPEYLEAATVLTQARTDWLQCRVRFKDDETLTGIWDDSNGGGIEVVELEGQLFFNLSVVRGPTSHGGDLSGVAQWNQTIGWFSDKGLEPDKKDVTNLAFILRGKMLEIIGANNSHYNGMRAYFDGRYAKVGTLDAKAQAKIIKEIKAPKP
ncbi:MAG: lysozyme inhibitor LprI family protein, partial [Prosthecobacter sp.]|nr:lysozyme inhibitor LprI family protein [Prosthecobacter sp.]